MSQVEVMPSTEQKWEPHILAFCCNWCSYAGADGAGTARMQYASNARVIRIMCSGRMNPLFIIKGFLSGADIVMMLGCHFGDCHYLKGNFACNRRMTLQISASEGIKFKETMDNIVKKALELGPISNELGVHAHGARQNRKALAKAEDIFD
jgi:F420-non-reducing hydrogenase iron-sulfur subunit